MTARAIATLVLDLEAVTYALECLPEDTPIRGNVQASGDEAQDREAEDTTIAALEGGNQWAWCCLKVTASLASFRGTEDDGCEYVADLPEGFDPDALAWRKGERPWGDVHRDYFAPLVPGGRWRLFVDDTPGSLCKNGTPPIGKADDGGGMVVLDLDAVRRGLQVMATECPRHFADLVNENDDATTADVFVQCCVFGEVIYG